MADSEIGSGSGLKLPRALKILLQLALTGVVLFFIVRIMGLNLGDLAQFDLASWAWRPIPLAGSVLLLLAGYIYSSLLWRQMVVEMGGPRISAMTAVRIFMVANLGRYVPGKVLQIAGLAMLARREGVSAATATSAAVLGQAFALAGATILGLGAFFGDHTRYRIYGWVGLAVMVALIVLSSIPGPSRHLQLLWMRVAARSGSDSAEEHETGAAVLGLGEAGFGLRWTGRYLLNWVIYGGAFWLLFLGMEEWATFLTIAPAFAAAYVVGYLAFFMPAGGGVREGMLIVLLAPIIGQTNGAAVAVLARVWTTVVEVLPAGMMAPGVLRGAGSETTASSGNDP